MTPDARQTPLERPLSDSGDGDDRFRPPAPGPAYPPALAAALVAALGELADVPATRTAKGRSFDYAYADLADVHAVTRPVLARHGLVALQRLVVEGGVVTVWTALVHVSGEAVVFGPVTLHAGGDAQAAGSAATYARRYGLCAALGVTSKTVSGTTSEDDDGRGAVAPSPQAARRQLETAAPRPKVDTAADRLADVQRRLADWRARLADLEDHPVAVDAMSEFVRAGLVPGARVTVAKGTAVLAALGRLEPRVVAAERDMVDGIGFPADGSGGDG